jgi:hypothetical protein
MLKLKLPSELRSDGLHGHVTTGHVSALLATTLKA